MNLSAFEFKETLPPENLAGELFPVLVFVSRKDAIPIAIGTQSESTPREK